MTTADQLGRPFCRGSPTMGDLRGAGGSKGVERLAARGDAELAQQALHVRTDGVLGDVQPSGDLIGAEMLVQQEQNLELARAQQGGDRVGDAATRPAFADLFEQPPRYLAGESRLAVTDAAEELGNSLGRLALE